MMLIYEYRWYIGASLRLYLLFWCLISPNTGPAGHKMATPPNISFFIFRKYREYLPTCDDWYTRIVDNYELLHILPLYRRWCLPGCRHTGNFISTQDIMRRLIDTRICLTLLIFSLCAQQRKFCHYFFRVVTFFLSWKCIAWYLFIILLLRLYIFDISRGRTLSCVLTDFPPVYFRARQYKAQVFQKHKGRAAYYWYWFYFLRRVKAHTPRLSARAAARAAAPAARCGFRRAAIRACVFAAKASATPACKGCRRRRASQRAVASRAMPCLPRLRRMYKAPQPRPRAA